MFSHRAPSPESHPCCLLAHAHGLTLCLSDLSPEELHGLLIDVHHLGSQGPTVFGMNP